MHLCAVQSQTIREGHGVLVGCVAGADSKNLHGTVGDQILSISHDSHVVFVYTEEG